MRGGCTPYSSPVVCQHFIHEENLWDLGQDGASSQRDSRSRETDGICAKSRSREQKNLHRSSRHDVHWDICNITQCHMPRRIISTIDACCIPKVKHYLLKCNFLPDDLTRHTSPLIKSLFQTQLSFQSSSPMKEWCAALLINWSVSCYFPWCASLCHVCARFLFAKVWISHKLGNRGNVSYPHTQLSCLQTEPKTRRAQITWSVSNCAGNFSPWHPCPSIHWCFGVFF